MTDSDLFTDPDALNEWADDVAGTIGGAKCYDPTPVGEVDPEDDPFPWDCTRANSRGPDYTRIVLMSVLMGESPRAEVRRMDVLREVFGDPTKADEQAASRLTTNHPEILRKVERDGLSAVFSPTRRAVSLTRSLIRSMQLRGRIPWVDGCLPECGDSSVLPLDRYAAIFGRCESVGTDRQRALALLLLRDHRLTLLANGAGGEVGRWIAGNGGQSVRATAQRSASPGRVAGQLDRFKEAMDGMADAGPWVWATFTLPRECADSAFHSYEVLSASMGRFHDRCRRSSAERDRPDEWPAFVAVTDAQAASGWAHRHVLYPGREHLYDADDVREDWREVTGAPADVDPQVSLETVKSGDHFDAVRGYMARPFERLRTLAAMDTDALLAVAERLETGKASDGDRALAATTMLWATGRDVWSVSGGPDGR